MAEVKLYNSDCKEVIENLKREYKNLCIVTDPPFNIGYHYKTYKDNLSEKEYLEFVGGGNC